MEDLGDLIRTLDFRVRKDLTHHMRYIRESSHPYFTLHRALESATSSPTPSLLSLIKCVNEVSITSSDVVRAMEKAGRKEFRFQPGDVVLHKVFNFRGIVQTRDPLPRYDVSGWDGLRDVEDLEQPFYVVIPDKFDTVKAFGGGENMEVRG